MEDDLTCEFVGNNNIKSFISCFEVIKVDETIKYKCLVDGCGCTITQKSNAIRHLRIQHKNISDAIEKNKTSTAEVQKKMEEIELRVKVDVPMIWDSCVNLVVKNALPVCIVDAPEFQALLKPYVIALHKKGITLTINAKTIKKHIEERAVNVHDAIIGKLRDKPVSLMVDIGSRYGRSIMGVNVAYFEDAAVKICTLDMQVLRMSATGENLEAAIKKVLDEHSIALQQVLAITTDNG